MATDEIIYKTNATINNKNKNKTGLEKLQGLRYYEMQQTAANGHFTKLIIFTNNKSWYFASWEEDTMTVAMRVT